MKYQIGYRLRLSFVMILSFLSSVINAETETGMLGENVKYVWDKESGNLNISGCGAMYDYDDCKSQSPFYD